MAQVAVAAWAVVLCTHEDVTPNEEAPMQDGQEVGHHSGSAVEEEHQEQPEGSTAVTPYHHQPAPPPARAPRASAPPSFRDLQGFVAELSSPEALERSQALAAAYDKAVGALVGPGDVQEADGKTFKCKSAWRKLGRHFFISVETTREPHGRWERFAHDDAPHYVAYAEVVATAPWGQQMPGFGACSTRELRFYTSGPACPACGGTMWDNRGDSRGPEDFACRDKAGCGGTLSAGEWAPEDLGRIPNTKARAKAEHDCLATAQTRAINRAISELIAMGEVSWEEVQGGEGSGAYGAPVARDADGRPKGKRGGKRKGSPARGKAPSLEDTVPFGNAKGRTWRELCESEPKDAWWYVNKAEKLSQPEKDMVREYLESLAETSAQEEAAEGSQEEESPATDPLEAKVPSGKLQGRTWRQALGADEEYFRKMQAHPWAQEHFPEGTELRAAVECQLAGEPLDPQHIVRRWALGASGDSKLLEGLATVHPELPEEVASWTPQHWQQVQHTARKRGWGEVQSRVRDALRRRQAQQPAGDSQTSHAPPAEPKITAKVREAATSALGMAARHHLPEYQEWKTQLEEALEAANGARVTRLVDNLKQEIMAHIGAGGSPVSGASGDPQKAIDWK